MGRDGSRMHCGKRWNQDALWEEMAAGCTVGRDGTRMHCGKRWQQDALWEEMEPGHTVARDGSRMHCGKRWNQDTLWEEMAAGCTLGRRQAIGVNVRQGTSLNIVADQVHPFTATVFLNGSGLFQQDNTPCHTTQIVQKWFQKVKGVALASTFPESQFDQASAGCAGTTSLNHGSCQVMVPDTTGHLQRSCRVHPHRGPTAY